MPKVEIRNQKVKVGNQSVPLLSGEVHYWRLHPSYWDSVLDKVKEMGIGIVSSYVPWDYHEYSRGEFDFEGRTDGRRDLKKFLQLTREKGFWLIIRPGPYIYSEWPNEGAPEYAHKFHRLHPKFLEFAHRYLKEVCRILVPFQATKPKGHILLLQADNEIDPWPDLFGEQYGLSGKPGMFQDFLRMKYGNEVSRLNENWGTSYRRFEEAGPFIACMFPDYRGLPLKGDRELRRNLDYIEFKYYYTKQCAQWVVQQYRKLGISIPIYLNLYPFFYAQDWSEIAKESDFVGIDLYPSNELKEDQHEQRKLMDKIRYLRTFENLPYIAEFAAGVWHARHYESGVLTPNHYRLITLSALLGGAVGWNWYMLVNRDNWYMSPINEMGRGHEELCQVFKDLVEIFKAIDPPSLKKLCDVGVTFIPIQYAARTMVQDGTVLPSLYEADIDYELYDPRIGAVRKKILFYSGNQWLDRGGQKNLADYVRSGGILVAFKDYPRKDDNFHDYDLLGFRDPSRILFEFKKKFTVCLNGKALTEVTSSVYAFDRVEGEKIEADVPGFGRLTIGYTKRLGKGKVCHIGVEPNKEIVTDLLRFFNVPVYVNSPTRDIKTAVFSKGKRFYLIAVNNGTEDKSATITFPSLKFLGSRWHVREIGKDRRERWVNTKQPVLSIELPRKDGKVFELSP